MSIKEALALGFELSGFFFASYYIHPSVAAYFESDANITLTTLLALSLVLWTLHAFLYFEKTKQ